MKKIEARLIRECSDRVRRTRIALGYKTQMAFCREYGIRYDIYAACERGHRRLSLAVALLMRDKLKIPLDWIYCGDARRLPAALHRALQKRK